MRNDIPLLRAVASVLLLRHVTRLFAVPAVVSACLLIATGWFMTTYGGWWVICFVALTALMLVACVAWLLSTLMARMLAPKALSRSERRDIAVFSDRLVTLTEQVRTPLPLLGVRLIRDMLLHRDLRTLHQIIDGSGTLRSDYRTLRAKIQ
ncbi:hypothetical protein IPL85_00300 [Candidatus Saccharibacteria bacterium]|nr:MAG: hypothetical protein IPL85_00300 [Candidatus Saccharibacteria bacterium]